MRKEKLAIDGGKPVREKKLFYGHQYIDDRDIEAVVEVLKSDYLTCGPKITELEKRLCEITGAKYAVAVSNGTAALLFFLLIFFSSELYSSKPQVCIKDNL